MDILIAFSRSLIGLIDVVLVPLIFAAAFVAFIWGVYLYFFLGAGNEEKRKEGRTFVVYGLIGFVLMLSLWGIVRMLTTSFGLGGQNRPALPFENSQGTSNQSRTTRGRLGEDCRPPLPGCEFGLACNTRTYVCVRPEDI